MSMFQSAGWIECTRSGEEFWTEGPFNDSAGDSSRENKQQVTSSLHLRVPVGQVHPNKESNDDRRANGRVEERRGGRIGRRRDANESAAF
jgi:hypothetical protein